MEAEIFSVGTEILLGNITDTNSQFLANALKTYGINVHKMVTVGDNYQRLLSEMQEADKKVDLIITTGGLGPTADDLTKEVAFEVAGLNEDVQIDEKSLERLKNRAGDDKRKLDKNSKQARFPKEATILENKNGTAPGCILKSKRGTTIVCMPGPPSEMQAMFKNKVAPRLPKNGDIGYRDLNIAILGERDAANRVNLNTENPTTAPYIKKEGAIIRIAARGKDEKEVNQLLDLRQKELEKELYPYLINSDGRIKPKVLIDLLLERGEKVVTAESITGGMLASHIIDVAGASQVLKESYIVYSNEAKEKILNVSRETLDKYSAVSKECAGEMLDGLVKKEGRELSMVTTGYAHTGEVYIGVAYKGRKIVRRVNLIGERNRLRFRVVNYCIDCAILLMRGVDDSYINF